VYVSVPAHPFRTFQQVLVQPSPSLQYEQGSSPCNYLGLGPQASALQQVSVSMSYIFIPLVDMVVIRLQNGGNVWKMIGNEISDFVFLTPFRLLCNLFIIVTSTFTTIHYFNASAHQRIDLRDLCSIKTSAKLAPVRDNYNFCC
jgi:hypothetical protein